jgi:hypothetical protein
LTFFKAKVYLLAITKLSMKLIEKIKSLFQPPQSNESPNGGLGLIGILTTKVIRGSVEKKKWWRFNLKNIISMSKNRKQK